MEHHDDRMGQETQGLWDRFSARLRSFIRRRVADDETAEDILQDVFIRIHSRMASLRDDSKLESWIYQIARNAIIDHYRSRKTTVELAETLPAEEEADDENAEAQLLSSLKELVDALPEPYREALLLTEFQGLSQKQLAEQLDISFSGAKSRVQRARQKVKDMLLTCCHFEFDRRGTVIDYWEHCCCCAGTEPA